MKKQPNSFPNCTWEQFKLVNENPTKEFENMCRDLFSAAFANNSVVHSNPNQPGIEVDPVQINGVRVSYQSKFFESKIDYRNIQDSMEKTAKYYTGKLDRVYLFCNLPISTKSSAYIRIENDLKSSKIDLYPISDQDIFSMLRNRKSIAEYYFMLRGKESYDDRIKAEWHDDNETYKLAYKEPLFLESQIDDGMQACLCDIYVPPTFRNQSGEKRSIDQLLNQFLSTGKTNIRKAHCLLILGKPGVGKSSYVSYLADRLYNTIHILRLRDLAAEQINIENPLRGLTDYLGITKRALENSTLVLDGLDEICALYHGQDFHDYLKKLLLYASKINKFKMIITSRTGYFALDGDIKRYCLIVNIENWDDEDLNKWSSRYISFHPTLREIIESNTSYLVDPHFSEKKAIFAVPILFYMANARGEFLSKHRSISSVYDAVLSEVSDKRSYDPTIVDHTRNIINPILARQICMEIAFAMFRCGRLSLPDDPFLESSETENAISTAIEKCSSSEHQLSAETKNKIKSLFGLTFYYNKKADKQNAVEFAHRTIAEYFTAEKIMQILLNSYDGMTEDSLCIILSDCIGHSNLTNEILSFMREKIEMTLTNPHIGFLRNALEKYLLSITVSGKLFFATEIKPWYPPLFDRIAIMFKIVLVLFSWLKCTPPNPNAGQKEQFINMIATIAKIESITNSKSSYLPFLLNGFDLSGGDFSNGNFNESDFCNANLTNAKFIGARICKGKFNHAIISGTNFHGAYLSEAEFISTNAAHNLNFCDSILRGTIFRKNQFVESRFTKASLINTRIIECSFRKKCDFRGAKFVQSCIDSTDISKLDFTLSIFCGDNGLSSTQKDECVNQLDNITLTEEQYRELVENKYVAINSPNIVNVKKDN